MTPSSTHRLKETEEHEAIGRRNFYDRTHSILEAAEERARESQHALGRKTARERLDFLLDEGSFNELNRYAGGDIEAGELGSAVSVPSMGVRSPSTLRISQSAVARWAKSREIRSSS